jgi:hypothetical protein
MDILNLISWIKAGNYRAALPTDVDNLIAVGAKDPSRDDGYLPLAVNAAPLQSLYNNDTSLVMDPSTYEVNTTALSGRFQVGVEISAGGSIVVQLNNPQIKATSTFLFSHSVAGDEFFNSQNLGISIFTYNDGSVDIELKNFGAADIVMVPFDVHFLIIA